jgi:long-chain acyl-CoA synthetase
MGHEQAYDSAPWKRHYSEEAAAVTEVSTGASSLAELVHNASERFGDGIAFTTCMPNGMSGSLTFREVAEMSDAFAAYLREELGLERGARVAVQMPNCLTYPVVIFGILKAGCVAVNVNPLYTPREMEHQFNDSGAQALVVMDMFADKVESVVAQTGVRHVVVTRVAEWFPPLVRGILGIVLKYWNKVIPKHGLEVTRIGEALDAGRRHVASGRVDVASYWASTTPADTALLQYTGGTTGVSKGAELSHGNILSNIRQIELTAGDHIESGKECVLTALPLYHIFAFSVNLLAFYNRGARNVLVPSPRPIQNCQRALENYKVSWISGVNTLYNAILNEEWFSLYPPPTMKVALAGGTALHKAVAERWNRIVGCPIAEGYGLTESSPALCFNPIGKSRPDSIGIPVPGTEIRIVDDEGVCVPPGEPGEIIARGPQVMQGYWNRPDETAKTLKDGWLYTGDVARMDEDGYFYIVDRKKDMILVSGFNVYPNEVEDCIARLDQVQESAVIGVPDAKSGEAVWAFVVLRESGLSAEDIRNHCKNELARYKVPSRVEFRDELPKTPVGKVLRKELRDEIRGKPPKPVAAASENVA